MNADQKWIQGRDCRTIAEVKLVEFEGGIELTCGMISSALLEPFQISLF